MSSLESNKNLAGIGAILLILSVVPYAGAVLGIIGVVLLLMAIKGFSNYYQDNTMYQNAFTGLIFYIVAVIAAAVAIVGLVLSVATIFLIGLGVIFGLVALVAAFIFFLLAAKRLRITLSTLAQKSGEHSFNTAGTLLWYGAILTIVFGVGLILIFFAWIFATIGFFSMRVPSQQSGQPQYGYAPAPPSATTASMQGNKFCPNCGAPVNSDATFCSHCGKQLT